MKGKFKFLVFPYFGLLISLFLYSFTQVDLSLTLSRASIVQSLQKSFQYLGFYQRTNSAVIFSIILIFLFVFYIFFLYQSSKNKINRKNLTVLISGIFVILIFSYNAFSYDLFNYIFDAKILSVYHQNPFLHRPDDFIKDPMLNFMRWTHRFYPYGISWLLLTVPISFAGNNIFLLTFFLFKILIGSFYLGTCFLIYKISEIIMPNNKISNTVFFALNPLVLIEGLVSAHNDMPMVFFTLLSLYVYLHKKTLFSALTYIFSLGIKYANVVLFPVIVYLFYLQKKSKIINWETIFVLSLITSIAAVVVATFRTTFQPWYFIFPLSLASFIWKKPFILSLFILTSIFCSSIYVPYVLLTDYAKIYPMVVLNLEIIAVVSTIILSTSYYLFIKFTKRV